MSCSNRYLVKDKDEDAKVLEFKHPLFQRDHPELMADIKRSSHASEDAPSGEELQALKAQVVELTTKVNFLYRIVSNAAMGDLFSMADESVERPLKWGRGGDMDDVLETILQLEGGGGENAGLSGGDCCRLNGGSAGERSEQGYDIRGAPYSHDFLKHRNFSGPRETTLKDSSTNVSSPSANVVKSAKRGNHPFSHAVAAFGTICSKYGGER